MVTILEMSIILTVNHCHYRVIRGVWMYFVEVKGLICDNTA